MKVRAKMVDRNLLLILLLLWLAAFSFRFYAYSKADLELHGDETEYVALADNLRVGNGFINESGSPTAWRTPGLPVFLTALSWLGIGELQSLRLAFVLIASCVAPVLALLGFALFGDIRIASLAGGFWALSTNSIGMSNWLYGGELATILFLLSLVFAIYSVRYISLPGAIGSGIFLAIAVLTRGYLIPVIPVIAIYLVYEGRRKWAAAFLFIVMAILGSWMIRNEYAVGKFTLSTETPEIIWMGNGPLAKGSAPGTFNSRNCETGGPVYTYLIERRPDFCLLGETAKAEVFFNEIRSQPGLIIKNFFLLAPKKALIFFSPISYLGFDAAYLAALLLTPLGIFVLYKSGGNGSILLLFLGILGLSLLLNLVTYADVRHRHPLNAILMLMASAGCIGIYSKIAQRSVSAAREAQI